MARWLIGVVVVVAAIIIAVVSLATPLAVRGLERAGVVVERLDSVHLTAGGIAAEGVKLGAPLPLSVDRVEIDAGWADLTSGRVGALLIDGLDLSLDLRQFGARDDETSGADPLAVIEAHLGEARLSDAKIAVASEGLDLAYSGGAALRTTDGKLALKTYGESDVTLKTPAISLEAEDVGIDATSSTDLSDLAAKIDVATLRHLNRPAYFSKLAVKGEVSGDLAKFVFKGEARPHVTQSVITFDGDVEPAAGNGLVRFETKGVTFEPDGLQLVDLTEMVPPVIEGLKGTIRAIGKVGWGGDSYLLLQVALDDLSLNVPPSAIEGLSGVIDFDSLAPLTTLPRQRLALRSLNIGLPLSDGVMTAGLGEGYELKVDQLQFNWAKGRLWANPFHLALDSPQGALTLNARGLHLPSVLEEIKVPGLDAEGILDGAIPMELQKDGVVLVKEGKLQARAPGVIRYTPEQMPSALTGQHESVGLLKQVLQNLHYQSLGMTMNGPPNGDMKLGVKIAGANPDVYGGHAIDFNLNLEGELANIVAKNIETYQLPEDIAENLRQFAK